MATREELHRLIDELPDNAIVAVERYLRGLRDPLLRALAEAPEDDEPSTPEEDASAAAAWQEYQRGEALSAEEAKRRLLP